MTGGNANKKGYLLIWLFNNDYMIIIIIIIITLQSANVRHRGKLNSEVRIYHTIGS